MEWRVDLPLHSPLRHPTFYEHLLMYPDRPLSIPDLSQTRRRLRKSTAPIESAFHSAMVAQTTDRVQTAEPFVTLSLPKGSALKLPQTKTPVRASTTAKTVDLSSRQRDSVVIRGLTTNHEPDEMSTPSEGRQKRSLLATTITSPVGLSNSTRSNIITLKYKKTPIIHQNGFARELNRTATPETPITDHADNIWVDGQNDRRSSVASSTENGARSSRRLRKLTTKAQALAGTNFLPSLQRTPDVESQPSRLPSLEVPDELVTDQTSNHAQDAPIDDTRSTTNADEAPLESVESPTVRTSIRERKPTVRAIEMESDRALRKRPASPITSDRVSKISKRSPMSTTKPSKLCLTTEDEEVDVAIDATMSAPETNKNVVFDEVIAPIEAGSDALQNSSEADALFDETANHPQALLSADYLDISAKAQETGGIATKSELCDLSCLSPPLRLLAFARVAADWPDSESDVGSEDESSDDQLDSGLPLSRNDTGQNSELMKRLRDNSCRCGSTRIGTVSADVIKEATGQQTDASGHMVTYDTNGGQGTNGDVHSVAATQKYRKPVGKQLDSGMPRIKILSSKNLPTTRRNMGLRRQNSGFEQRMQADYLASKQGKSHDSPGTNSRGMVGKPPSGAPPSSTVLSSPGRSVRTRASAVDSGILLPGKDTHREVSDYRTNTHASNHEPRKPATVANPETDGHTDIIEALITHQKQTQSPSVPNIMKSKGGKTREVSGKRPGKTGLQGAGRTSAGGSIRLSLHDPVEPEKPKIVKQQASILPQASIKLKFTTAAR